MKKDPVIEKILALSRDMVEVKADLQKTATKEQAEQLIQLVTEYLIDVKRLDQERVVMAGSIARIHDKDREQDAEIDAIKTHVGLPVASQP